MVRHLLVFAALISSMSLSAQQRTFILQEEDDSLVRPSLASDSGYTNGTRLLWRWTPVEGEWTKTIADALCRHAKSDDCEQTVTAGLGQNMYTPEYLRSRTPIVGDRPYGGWLYGTVMFDAARPRTIDHIELYLGVIGRDSHAADAQIFVHKHVTTKAPDPLGWDTQIGEWAAVLAAYQRRVKLVALSAGGEGTKWLDVTPAIGGEAGNVFVNVSASTTVRLGYNLPSTFIEPIPGGPLAFRAGAAKDWDAFVYGVANASYVARNVFLDAEDDKYRIERRSEVRQHRGGVSARFRHFRFTYQYTWCSSEFRPLVHRLNQSSGPHSYGMVMLSFGPKP